MIKYKISMLAFLLAICSMPEAKTSESEYDKLIGLGISKEKSIEFFGYTFSEKVIEKGVSIVSTSSASGRIKVIFKIYKGNLLTCFVEIPTTDPSNIELAAEKLSVLLRVFKNVVPELNIEDQKNIIELATAIKEISKDKEKYWEKSIGNKNIVAKRGFGDKENEVYFNFANRLDMGKEALLAGVIEFL